MELEDLGRLVAELAAGALAQFRDLGARRGQRSVQPLELRGDLGFVDGAVRDHLFGGTHQECAPDNDAVADGDAFDALHGVSDVAPGSAWRATLRVRPCGAVSKGGRLGESADRRQTHIRPRARLRMGR